MEVATAAAHATRHLPQLEICDSLQFVVKLKAAQLYNLQALTS